jgi:hypothetical protein
MEAVFRRPEFGHRIYPFLPGACENRQLNMVTESLHRNAGIFLRVFARNSRNTTSKIMVLGGSEPFKVLKARKRFRTKATKLFLFRKKSEGFALNHQGILLNREYFVAFVRNLFLACKT